MRAVMIVAAGLAMIAGSAHAQWQITGIGEGGYSAVDKSSIVSLGNTKRAWVVAVPRPGGSNGYVLGRFTFDCQQATRSQTDVYVYDASGKLASQSRNTGAFVSVRPDSIFIWDYRAVCENLWEPSTEFESPADVFEYADTFFRLIDQAAR